MCGQPQMQGRLCTQRSLSRGTVRTGNLKRTSRPPLCWRASQRYVHAPGTTGSRCVHSHSGSDPATSPTLATASRTPAAGRSPSSDPTDRPTMLVCSLLTHLWTQHLCTHSRRAWLECVGADKTVTVWDLRAMKVTCRWSPNLKYDITYITFLDSHPGCALTAGLDPEVLCGRWQRQPKVRVPSCFLAQEPSSGPWPRNQVLVPGPGT